MKLKYTFEVKIYKIFPPVSHPFPLRLSWFARVSRNVKIFDIALFLFVLLSVVFLLKLVNRIRYFSHTVHVFAIQNRNNFVNFSSKITKWAFICTYRHGTFAYYSQLCRQFFMTIHLPSLSWSTLKTCFQDALISHLYFLIHD